MLYFITGNKKKYDEVKALLHDVEQIDIDLPEIQELDAHKVIRAKLEEAYKHLQGECIVEDTSLRFECLGELPGTFIKWFLNTLGNEGLAQLVMKYGNSRAVAKTVIGYARSSSDVYFFEGEITGSIIEPRVPSSFGWDPIFLPDGHDKTFAEMDSFEKNTISMRRIAVEKLKDFMEGR
jgi:non-canonical purine NTP pyrophosphatase (RdgB/HAM1 family)